jgi:hypothetical protein
MVTLDRVGGSEINKSCEFAGLSTDEKPISPEIPNGSSYLCMDSGEVYFYNSSAQTWVLPQ